MLCLPRFLYTPSATRFLELSMLSFAEPHNPKVRGRSAACLSPQSSRRGAAPRVCAPRVQGGAQRCMRDGTIGDPVAMQEEMGASAFSRRGCG